MKWTDTQLQICFNVFLCLLNVFITPIAHIHLPDVSVRCVGKAKS